MKSPTLRWRNPAALPPVAPAPAPAIPCPENAVRYPARQRRIFDQPIFVKNQTAADVQRAFIVARLKYRGSSLPLPGNGSAGSGEQADRPAWPERRNAPDSRARRPAPGAGRCRSARRSCLLQHGVHANAGIETAQHQIGKAVFGKQFQLHVGIAPLKFRRAALPAARRPAAAA